MNVDSVKVIAQLKKAIGDLHVTIAILQAQLEEVKKVEVKPNDNE